MATWFHLQKQLGDKPSASGSAVACFMKSGNSQSLGLIISLPLK